MPAPDLAPVVVAYDGSDSAHDAIETVSRLFPHRRAIVVSVWESNAAAAPATLLAVPAGATRRAYARLDEKAESDALALASEAVAALRATAVVAAPRALLSHVNIWSTIANFAEEQNAAVLVVGSRGRSNVKSALLGSVSSGLVHHARCPVTVVRGHE